MKNRMEINEHPLKINEKTLKYDGDMHGKGLWKSVSEVISDVSMWDASDVTRSPDGSPLNASHCNRSRGAARLRARSSSDQKEDPIGN